MGESVIDPVALHCHTDKSKDGIMAVDPYVKRCAELGYTHAAISEHGNLFSAVDFTEACIKHSVFPCYGIEAYYSHQGHKTRPEPGQKFPRAAHLSLIAKNKKGWENIRRLSSIGYLDGFYHTPNIDLGLLNEHAEGVLGMSGCMKGVLNDLLFRDKEREALQLADNMGSIFGKDNFYLEIMPHSTEGQHKANQFMKKIHKNFGFPYVMTLDCHYLHKSDGEAFSARMNIWNKKTISDPSKMGGAKGEYYVRSPDEMRAFDMSDYPGALENTRVIADQCNFVLPLNKIQPPKFNLPKGVSAKELFKQLIDQGMQRMMPYIEKTGIELKKYYDRIDYEFDVIKKTGFIEYFLIVEDVLRFCRENNVEINDGRGSVCGSLIAYVLGIHDVDVLLYQTSFDRFLSESRGAGWPDIDCDISSIDFDRVIDHLRATYGDDRIANICTYSTFKGRSVIRDVGRVYEIPPQDINAIATLIPESQRQASSLSDCEESIPEFKKRFNNYPQLKDIALKLEGKTRHTGIHAGGIVISPKPLLDIAPVMRDPKSGRVGVQLDKIQVDKYGLLKFDFLRVKAIDVVKGTLASINKHEGKTIIKSDIPVDDEATFDMFCAAKTDGIPQFNSALMKRLLTEYLPRTIKDLVMVNALARPGAEYGAEDIFAARRGDINVTYLIPELEPILKSTYGRFVYQEQMMRAARDIAGFTPEESNTLRKACGKKDKKLMEKQRKKFVSGCIGNGLTEKKATKLFNIIELYAEYGFSLNHSQAYSQYAYRVAYLKQHYPAHFIAAALTVEGHDEDGVPFGEDIDGYDQDMKPIRDTSKDLWPMIKSAEEWGETSISFL